MLVFDATPLIYLATVDQLDLLDELEDDCVVPEPVYDEVVTAGIEGGHPDARRIERAVEDGTISVSAVDETDLAERLRRNPSLSDADVAVIAYAAAIDGLAVMDERYGRATGDTEGVETRGTVWILTSVVRSGGLSGEEAIDVLDAMIDAGWYCSTGLYTRIVRTLRSLDE